MKLKGKTAVITGASQGIGKQIALKLAKQGVLLALIARNEESLKEVKREAEKLGSPKVEIYSCDLRDTEQIRSTVGKVISDFKRIDILINNAGIWQKVGPVEDAKVEDIVSVMSTNLTAVVTMTNLVLPELKKQAEAALINISSHSGVDAKPGQSIYSASKWGVRGFTEVLRNELKETNVRVAGIYQGGTRTDMFGKANDPKEKELFDKYTDPADLADVIVFMLSRPSKIWLHDVRVEF